MSSTHHLANGESEPPRPTVLTSSASIKVRRKNSISHSRVDSEVDDFIHMLHGSDPIRLELSRLENELRDKERELGDAHAEIKGLKHSDRLKEKAVEELTDELNKVDGKLKATEAVLESKNLEIRKLNEEKKAALAAQFAAEATLRRVHAAQKDDDMPPIEAIIAPLEAELKLARQEVAKLQDDNRALDRLTKSKEAALLEAEKTVKVALVKASMVDDLQNKNQELMKQIEICQEENKILDKMHRQKVAEVEKLTQTVRELEEAVLAGGAAANAVRDYQRKVQEMNEEKKTVDRELARAKVTANRVAVVVANEWKDASDKVMPVKQWIEERKQYQGEMQLLRDKLAVAERTAKAEAQLKEKYQLRFKVLEERLKTSSSSSSSRIMSEARSASSGRARRQSLGGAESLSRLPSNGLLSKRVVTNSPSHVLKSNSAAMLVKNAKISSNIFDGGDKATEFDQKQPAAINDTQIGDEDGKPAENVRTEGDDSVSGALYDMLQKEVITLRKACSEKDQSLKDKDNAIEISKPLKLNSNKGSMPFAFIFLFFFFFFHMKSSLTWLEFCELNQMLSKKVDTLSKAMEVEAKKMRRQVQTMEKEVTAIRASKESDQRARRLSTPRGMNASPARIARNTRNL